jgi:hypothetical protein
MYAIMQATEHDSRSLSCITGASTEIPGQGGGRSSRSSLVKTLRCTAATRELPEHSHVCDRPPDHLGRTHHDYIKRLYGRDIASGTVDVLREGPRDLRGRADRWVIMVARPGGRPTGRGSMPDPRLVAARRVRGVIDRAVGQQRGEPVPEGLQQP